MPWFNRRFGNPSNPSFVPNIFYGSSENMTFSERLHNTFLEFLTEQLYHPLFDWPAQNMLATYVGEDVPPVEVRARLEGAKTEISESLRFAYVHLINPGQLIFIFFFFPFPISVKMILSIRVSRRTKINKHPF